MKSTGFQGTSSGGNELFVTKEKDKENVTKKDD